MRLPIFFCIATHLFLCEVFAIHEEFTLKRPPENYLPQKNMSADFISPQFKTQFVLVPTINSRESEKIGDTQKNQINSLLYANFRNRFRKEFEILKIQGIKKSRGDEEMLTLYYDTILVEINDRIVLL
jgi:hypothetical protein